MLRITVLLTLIEFSSASIGIHRNASDPIFRTNNTDQIIYVNRGNNPLKYDQVNSTKNNQTFPSITVVPSSELLKESTPPLTQRKKDFDRDLNSDYRSNGIMVSTSTTNLGSKVASKFHASPEHWWRQHVTRIQDLKWRSAGFVNFVRETNNHKFEHDSNSFNISNANNSQNNYPDTLILATWTIYVMAIYCFICLIFLELWYRAHQKDVTLSAFHLNKV